MKLKQFILIAAMLMAAVPMQAQAATLIAKSKTATLSVSMLITAPAPIVGKLLVNGPLDFGTVLNTSGTFASATTTLSVNVTKGTPYTITMGPGLNGYKTNQGPSRLMTTGNYTPGSQAAIGSTVSYNIYTNAAHTRVWGDQGNLFSTGTFQVKNTGTGFQQTISAFAQTEIISSTRQAGSFTDTVTVTLTY